MKRDNGLSFLYSQRLANFFYLRADSRCLLAETVLFSRARRTAGTNDSGVLLRSLGNPADVQNGADTVELTARTVRDRARAAIGIATCLYLVDRFQWIDVFSP